MRLAAVLVSVLVALPMLAACGAGTSTARGPAGEVLFVRDGASGDGARIVAFHPGGPALRTLPAGLVSHDHSRVYTAEASGGSTTVRAIDAATGAALREIHLSGTYTTGHAGFADAVMSPDGRWLALRAQDAPAATTKIALADTQAGALAKTITLPGSYELDALSPDGEMLYLLEYPNRADHHYYVRAYNVTGSRLVDALIVDKTEPEENMNGAALARVMAPDGSAAYTLYIDTGRNIAFIHELPLVNHGDGPFFARCIDLPHGTSGALLPYYTLALSADGQTLYAVNAALGLASAIGVHPQNLFSDKVDVSGRFSSDATSDATHLPRNAAALSRDGHTVYVAGSRGIWALEAASLRELRSYLADRSFTGLATSADGQTLYAVAPDSGITLLDLPTGQARATLDGPAASPWSIDWMTS